ncbi:hypothetical protein BROUX41_005333 [Berkeleyomyces rouxiae]|uniref:uncharacterized protein n=1 Tax=Berkeleyomyces rouxiae TaxID=2035830 RepID=UPI003B7E5078
MAPEAIAKKLETLRSAPASPEQLTLLRYVKNELIGDVSKKEKWVRCGLLPVMKSIITSHPSIVSQGIDQAPSSQNHLRHGENACLQAIQITTSLVSSARPQFLDPIFHADIVVALADNVDLTKSHPQIVLASLRALVAIADTMRFASNTCALTNATLSDAIFRYVHLESLRLLLLMKSTEAPHDYTQAGMVAMLLGRLTMDNKRRVHIAKSGILDALATRLASFAVAEDMAVPGAQEACRQYGIEAYYPAPEHRIKPAVILEAISNVIGNSKYLACMLIYSPAILAAFPMISCTLTPNATRYWSNSTSTPSRDIETLGAMDYALPPLTVTQKNTDADAARRVTFIPASFDGLAESENKFRSSVEVEQESPLVPFLILLCRTCEDALDRLMAIAVLAALFKAGCGTKTSREASIALLVIPVLMEIIRQYRQLTRSSSAPYVDSETAAAWYIAETAPLVLGRLIRDSETLQKAVIDGKGIELLAHLLGAAYNPCPKATVRRWSPNPNNESILDGVALSCRLGERGQLPLMTHNIKMRENTIKAIACLAASKEEYRVSFSEQHPVVSYISESLHLFPRKPRSKDKDRCNDKSDSKRGVYYEEYGTNSVAVIEAACHAVRVLSRSPKILRTALIDHAVHDPIYDLLQSENLNLVIAASAAMCNLVLEVSPLRGALLEQCDLISTLAKLAHSPNPELRLNAIWALVHLVDRLPLPFRQQTLHAIGPEWLVRMINEDAQDDALAEAQKVRTNDLDNDTNMNVEDHEDVESTGELMRPGPAPAELGGISNSNIPFLNQHEALLKLVGEYELDPLRKARREDIAIQEQSLNFIRNIIADPDQISSTSRGPREIEEAVDLVVKAIGLERLFQVLSAKLKPRCLRPFSRRQPSDGNISPGGKSRMLYPQPNIVVSVIYILANIAGGASKYHDVILAQKDILKAALSYMTSPEKEIKLAVNKLLTNLTCCQPGTQGRSPLGKHAEVLSNLGFLTKLKDLESSDPDVAVREAAKLACTHLKDALTLSEKAAVE